MTGDGYCASIFMTEPASMRRSYGASLSATPSTAVCPDNDATVRGENGNRLVPFRSWPGRTATIVVPAQVRRLKIGTR
jgi:hypothetical protein